MKTNKHQFFLFGQHKDNIHARAKIMGLYPPHARVSRIYVYPLKSPFMYPLDSVEEREKEGEREREREREIVVSF